MIFLDESGQRWKRIKHSTAGVTLISVLPVVALIGGSLAYHPQWGVLSLIKPATGVVLSGAAKLQPGNPTQAAPKMTTRTIATASKAIAKVVYPAAGSSLSTVASPTQPVATTTPPQVVAPKGGNPVQNDFGQSHKPLPKS